MMRDSAVFRHTVQDRGHPERMRSAPRGGTAAEGADIPPPGNSTGPDWPQAGKIGAAWADSGCSFGPPLLFGFPFSGRFPGSPPFPRFLRSGVCFPGFGGPPVVWLGFAPRD